MVTLSRTVQATRTGTRGAVVVEGVDVIVQSFTRDADTIRPRAGVAVVKAARDAAQRMRDRVPIDEDDLLDSISADHVPTFDGSGVSAAAGPDRTRNKGAFKAHFHEHGTAKMAPTPFVGPAADETAPELARAIRDLPRP